MTCFSKNRLRRMIFACVFLQSAYAGLWSSEVHEIDTNPPLIRMITSYTPQYFGRDGNGFVGRFKFGEETRKIHVNEICANDDTPPCFIKHRKMDKGEYREFKDMSLFFRKEGSNLLCKITIEQTFPCESQARERTAIMNDVIEDCKQCYGLLLSRKVVCDGRVVYLCADDVFEIKMELNRIKDGERRLSLSVTNKKVRDGKVDTHSKTLSPVFDADRDIEISI